MREEHPDAELLVHPECGCTTSFLYYDAAGDLPGKTHFCSTEGMVRHAKQSPAQEFIIATETGILHRMRQDLPEKKFYPAREEAVCQYMKKITLEKVLRSLEEDIHHVTVPPEIARRRHNAASASSARPRPLKPEFSGYDARLAESAPLAARSRSGPGLPGARSPGCAAQPVPAGCSALRPSRAGARPWPSDRHRFLSPKSILWNRSGNFHCPAIAETAELGQNKHKNNRAM
jgi:hypothetical protein